LTLAVHSLAQTGPVDFLVIVALAAVLATLIFSHAHTRGNRHATAWGVFTFLAAGIAIPFYFLSFWLGKNRRSR
jgi:hypothetical protein